MNRLKIIAVVYLVKTLLVGIAWLIVPDLPQRAMTKARETWTAVSGGGELIKKNVPEPSR
jgi:hypothetical protein